MSREIIGYFVTLISKDKQRYLYKSRSVTEELAITEAKQKIIDKHWDNYNYKLEKITPILKGEN
jgi:hypothetical protein